MDIEGFEEDDDGKPKTPAPVRKTDLLKVGILQFPQSHGLVHTSILESRFGLYLCFLVFFGGKFYGFY